MFCAHMTLLDGPLIRGIKALLVGGRQEALTKAEALRPHLDYASVRSSDYTESANFRVLGLLDYKSVGGFE